MTNTWFLTQESLLVWQTKISF